MVAGGWPIAPCRTTNGPPFQASSVITATTSNGKLAFMSRATPSWFVLVCVGSHGSHRSKKNTRRANANELDSTVSLFHQKYKMIRCKESQYLRCIWHDYVLSLHHWRVHRNVHRHKTSYCNNWGSTSCCVHPICRPGRVDFQFGNNLSPATSANAIGGAAAIAGWFEWHACAKKLVPKGFSWLLGEVIGTTQQQVATSSSLDLNLNNSSMDGLGRLVLTNIPQAKSGSWRDDNH